MVHRRLTADRPPDRWRPTARERALPGRAGLC